MLLHEPVNYYSQYKNSLNMQEFSIRELFFLDEAPCSVYQSQDHSYVEVISKGAIIDKQLIRKLSKLANKPFYVHTEQYSKIIKGNQDQLIKASRSLSVSDPSSALKRHLHLTVLNLEYLYQDPTNDEILIFLFQCLKSM